jgi:hypothetical protein
MSRGVALKLFCFSLIGCGIEALFSCCLFVNCGVIWACR